MQDPSQDRKHQDPNKLDFLKQLSQSHSELFEHILIGLTSYSKLIVEDKWLESSEF